jgi:hypothetical protein
MMGREGSMERKRVGILIFPEVEVLDFCGPFEVFAATRLDSTKPGGEKNSPPSRSA